MNAPTTAAVALSWGEVQALPEPMRARVAYEWRHRCQARRVRTATDIEDALLTAIEAQQILTTITPDPPALVERRRRDAVREADSWIDPRRTAA